MLEKAGVIVQSVSPWVSPTVIVPKKTSPGEPPRHCMCVDYHVLNSLLPCVDKAHYKVKGILTLVPILKIDQKSMQSWKGRQSTLLLLCMVATTT